jgi:hypothetical protein
MAPLVQSLSQPPPPPPYRSPYASPIIPRECAACQSSKMHEEKWLRERGAANSSRTHLPQRQRHRAARADASDLYGAGERYASDLYGGGEGSDSYGGAPPAKDPVLDVVEREGQPADHVPATGSVTSLPPARRSAHTETDQTESGWGRRQGKESLTAVSDTSPMTQVVLRH